jgi:hypothetical protein
LLGDLQDIVRSRVSRAAHRFIGDSRTTWARFTTAGFARMVERTAEMSSRAHTSGTIRRRQHSSRIQWELCMPYTRPIRRFYLTPPRLPTFIISLVLAVLAVVTVYGHFSQLHGINGFVFLLIAWGVLMAGVLIRGI